MGEQINKKRKIKKIIKKIYIEKHGEKRDVTTFRKPQVKVTLKNRMHTKVGPPTYRNL